MTTEGVLRRRPLILSVFVLLVTAGLFVAVTNGSVNIPAEEVWQSLLSGNPTTNGQIIGNIRLPRALTAALAGVNLSLSGAILQAVMKNPLADPHIIGISSGAGLAGIFVMLVYPQAGNFVPLFAFVGAMGAAVLIYVLAWKNGISPVRIILAGVAVSAFLGAGISFLLIFYSDRVHGALMWMIGGLSARSWPHVYMLLPYTAAGTILAFMAARHINVLQLGDDLAKSLGLRVELTRLFLTALAALLAASAVSAVGLLGFVGLIVPHTARLLLVTDYRFLLPGAALLGAATVTFCDTFARCAFAPTELPVGIIMAVLGAPFFLFLLRRDL